MPRVDRKKKSTPNCTTYQFPAKVQRERNVSFTRFLVGKRGKKGGDAAVGSIASLFQLQQVPDIFSLSTSRYFLFLFSVWEKIGCHK